MNSNSDFGSATPVKISSRGRGAGRGRGRGNQKIIEIISNSNSSSDDENNEQKNNNIPEPVNLPFPKFTENDMNQKAPNTSPVNRISNSQNNRPFWVNEKPQQNIIPNNHLCQNNPFSPENISLQNNQNQDCKFKKNSCFWGNLPSNDFTVSKQKNLELRYDSKNLIVEINFDEYLKTLMKKEIVTNNEILKNYLHVDLRSFLGVEFFNGRVTFNKINEKFNIIKPVFIGYLYYKALNFKTQHFETFVEKHCNVFEPSSIITDTDMKILSVHRKSYVIKHNELLLFYMTENIM